MHLMHDRRQVQTKYTNKFTEKFISCYLNVAQFVFGTFFIVLTVPSQFTTEHNRFDTMAFE